MEAESASKEKPVEKVRRRRPPDNQVKVDGVLKETVFLQERARNSWKAKWGFLEDIKTFYSEASVKQGLPPDYLWNRPEKHWMVSRTPVIAPPSPPIPKTSSAMIGWRSTEPSCALETMGPMYVSPKRTIDPPNLPKRQPQFHIFIG